MNNKNKDLAAHILHWFYKYFSRLLLGGALWLLTLSSAHALSCSALDFVAHGDASIEGLTGELVITPDERFKSGQFWSMRKLDLAKPFDFSLSTYLGTRLADGGDGITFTIHTDPRYVNAFGADGGRMGVDNDSSGIPAIKPSLVVEFDTVFNSNPEEIRQHHTGVYLDGDVFQSATGNILLPAKSVGDGNISDGKYYPTRYVWNPSAKRLQYYFDDVLLGTINIDLLSHLGSRYATIGFTGSTGMDTNLQKICIGDSPDLVGVDFSDAPLSYGDAMHGLVDETRLGDRVDFDTGSLAGNHATGDGTDDDGVAIPHLDWGRRDTIAVKVNQTSAGRGYLQGWIDWNGNGVFEGGEQVARDLQLTGATSGTINVEVTVPGSATGDMTFARFRWSSTPGLGAITAAGDGEVEDYAVQVGWTGGTCSALDFVAHGDAFIHGLNQELIITPDARFTSGQFWSPRKLDLGQPFDFSLSTYLGTRLADGGDGITFTIQNDPRNVNAFGADGGRMGVDYDDRARTPAIEPSVVVEFDTVFNATPEELRDHHTGVYLDGDVYESAAENILLSARSVGDGNISDGKYYPTRYVWNPATKQLQYYFDGVLLGTINIDLISHLGTRYATIGFTGSTGMDTNLQKICFQDAPALKEVDFSDSPASYGDATHSMVDGLRMGDRIDGDPGSLASANAFADGTDDDGIEAIPALGRLGFATIPVSVHQTDADKGYLQGWIDWNGDGDFADADEQIATNLQLRSGNSGTINVLVSVPSIATVDVMTFARFRWSTTRNLNSTAPAGDGEVEDYALSVSASSPDGSCRFDGWTVYNTVSELRRHNIFTKENELLTSLPFFHGDIGYGADGQLYAIEGKAEDYVIYRVDTATGAHTIVLSGSEVKGATALSGDQLGWMYFGSGMPGDPNNSRIYRFKPGVSTRPELWLDMASYGFPGLSSGDFIFVDDVVYVGYSASETSINDTLLKIENLNSDTHAVTGSTKITQLGIIGDEIWGLSGNDNGDLFAISSKTKEILRVKTSPFRVSSEGSLVTSDRLLGATSIMESSGVRCRSQFFDSDYSDAPASYGDATHSVTDDIRLGDQVDGDEASLASSDASGDGADDDSTFIPTLIRGYSRTIDVVVNQPTANSGYLQGWVDWNRDGDFADAGEQVARNLRLGSGASGTIGVPLNAPSSALTGQTFARFRWSTTPGLGITDHADDGEVEDYILTVNAPPTTPPVCRFDGWMTYNTVTELRRYNVFTKENELMTNLSLAHGDIAYGNDGELYGIEGKADGYVVYRIDKVTGAHTIVLSGTEASNATALSGDQLGWMYFGSGLPGDPNNSKIYRFKPGVSTRPELWLDMASYGFPGLSSGDYIFLDGVVYVGYSGSEDAINDTLLKIENLNPTTHAVTDSTRITQLGLLGDEIWGLSGNDNGDLFAVSNKIQEILRVQIAPFKVTSEGPLVAPDRLLGASSSVEYNGVSCPSPFDEVFIASDFSDAPASYGDAKHDLIDDTRLGNKVDGEPDSLASSDASGDGSDDDGVAMPDFIPGRAVTLSVAINQTAGNRGYLQGWIDWNGDGDFSDSGEQVASNLRYATGTSGTINVPVTVPSSAKLGRTFARLRWSTTAGLGSTTSADDGEVEDYAVIVATAGAFVDACIALDSSAALISATPDGVEDSDFPKGYWVASYYEGNAAVAGGVNGQSGSAGAGTRVFRGEAFWGIGENPVTISSNGTAANNRWSNTETPTSPKTPPSYVGSTWTSSGNPFYEISYRREIEDVGTLRFGYGDDEILDDTLEIRINGEQVFAYWPAHSAPSPAPDFRPGLPGPRGVSIAVSPGDKVDIRFINLGHIGGLSFHLDTLGVDCNNGIGGNIFEDLNYGGGRGRSSGSASTRDVSEAMIEVYDNGGNYLSAVQSDDDGSYFVPGLTDGDYYIRAVSNSIRSSRSGGTGSEIPVMTYRSNGVTAVTNEVGGRHPKLADASTNADGSRLNTGSFIFNSGSLNTRPAQAIQPIILNDGKVEGVDFGFNFNTVVNTNASGQGSLKQFISNNNNLSGAGITQQLPAAVASDYTTNDVVAVFMIPPSQLNGSGEALITTSSSLAIDKPRIIIDGRIQAANMGRGSIVLKGLGSGVNSGVNYSANTGGSVLRDFSVRDFGGSGVVINGTASGNSVRVEQTTLSNNGQYGVLLENNAARNNIIANTIHNNGWAGIANDAKPNNTFSQNSLYDNGGLGIDLGLNGVTNNNNTDGWLNYPNVNSESGISSNGTTVVAYDFDLEVGANTHGYRVEFFSNTSVDPSGHGEGLTYLGFVDLSSGGGGIDNYKGSFNANSTVPENANIAVTLIEKTGENQLGMTSEFSTVNNRTQSVCTNVLANPGSPLPSVRTDEGTSTVLNHLEARDDDGNPVNYVISGSDAGQFLIKPASANPLIDCASIEFINNDIIVTRSLPVNSEIRNGPFGPPVGDYEAPADSDRDNVYELFITAIDINGNESTRPLLIIVQNVNERPSIVTPSTISYAERQSIPVVDLEAHDPDLDDAEGSGITYRITGGDDAGQFAVDSFTGELSFNNLPDFDRPTDSDSNNLYELTVKVSDDEGYANSKDLFVTVTDDPSNDGIRLRVRTLLQGAYETEAGLMHDELRVKGLLPVAQPYQVEPFNYEGAEEINLDLVLVDGAAAIVDWVLLELRELADPVQLVASRAVLLQRDGTLVDAASGSSVLNFPAVPAGDYYVSVRHRNHLGVVTAQPLLLTADANAHIVDFARTDTQVQGEHARLFAVNNDEDEIALLWSGDMNHDQRIVALGQGNDTNLILIDVLSHPENTSFHSSYIVDGYHNTDLNMDGEAVFMGPGNDTNILLGNILLFPANEGFLGNFVVSGSMQHLQ